MSKLRSVNTKFWSDTFIVELDPIEKLVFLYLITNENTNMLGIYELHIRRIAFDTGIDKDMLVKIFARLERAGKAKYIEGFIVLPNFLKHQNFNPKMEISAIRTWNSLPEQIMSDSFCNPILKIIKAFRYTDELIEPKANDTFVDGAEVVQGDVQVGEAVELSKSAFYAPLVSVMKSIPVPKDLDTPTFRKRIFDFNLMWCDRDKRVPAIQTIEQQYAKLYTLKDKGDDPVKVVEYAIEGGWRRFYDLPDESSKGGKSKTNGQQRSDFLNWLNKQPATNDNQQLLIE